MADFITKAQYEELENLEDLNMCCGAEEFNKLLEKYAGIKARPYTAYQYFDENGNYIGDSNEDDLDDLLQSAYVEVRDGRTCHLSRLVYYAFRWNFASCRISWILWLAGVPGMGKMSRKRFVKLCMGRLGLSRNLSNHLASIARLDTYRDKMACLLFWHSAVPEEDMP